MTREEIKNTPKIVDCLLSESVMSESKEKLHKRLDKICNLAIQALEQEPCEDMERKIEKEYLFESLCEDLKKLQAENENLRNALEQEPKIDNDCISRKSVFDLMRSLTRWGVRSEDGKFNNVGLLYDDVMFGIDKIPSVNPQEPKTGHWIYDDDCHEHGHCSECGTKEDLVDGKNRYFCRFCGARMSEVEQ